MLRQALGLTLEYHPCLLSGRATTNLFVAGQGICRVVDRDNPGLEILQILVMFEQNISHIGPKCRWASRPSLESKRSKHHRVAR
jgi:hypothetical protein